MSLTHYTTRPPDLACRHFSGDATVFDDMDHTPIPTSLAWDHITSSVRAFADLSQAVSRTTRAISHLMTPERAARIRETNLRKAEAAAQQAELLEHEYAAKGRAKDPAIRMQGELAQAKALRLRQTVRGHLLIVTELTDFTPDSERDDGWSTRHGLETLARSCQDGPSIGYAGPFHGNQRPKILAA